LSLGPHKIKDVKGAFRFKDPAHLAQRLLPFVRPEVVEHERGEDSIEGRLGIREVIRKALIELDRDSCSMGLSSASGERLQIGVESNNFDTGVRTLDQSGQSPRSAPDVENAVSRSNGRLIEKCPPYRINA
jgi:hypothetical protein